MGGPPPAGAVLGMHLGNLEVYFLSVDRIGVMTSGGCSFRALGPGLQNASIRYAGIGSAFSFLLGRKPGSLPEDIVAEMWPTFVVLGLWSITYSVPQQH